MSAQPDTQPETQPDTQPSSRPHQLQDALRQELLRLARHEDDAASREAARVHYWEPTPVTVVVHRQCAAALRDAADQLLPTYDAVRGQVQAERRM